MLSNFFSILNDCKYTVYLLAILFVLSCENNHSKDEPDDLIAIPLMGRVVADVLLMESFTTQKSMYLEGRNAQVMLEYNYPMIDQKYGLADSQFIHSYQYYIQDPEAFSKVMEVALDTLQRLEKKTLQPADSTKPN
jgi:Domain of unknown function (DUF4296)